MKVFLKDGTVILSHRYDLPSKDFFFERNWKEEYSNEIFYITDDIYQDTIPLSFVKFLLEPKSYYLNIRSTKENLVILQRFVLNGQLIIPDNTIIYYNSITNKYTIQPLKLPILVDIKTYLIWKENT